MVSSSAWGEGFPNVVLEAAVAGLPCVVTDIGASAEIAGDGGRVVPPRDVPALTSAILDVAGLDPETRAAMGAAARAHAIEHYSLSSVVDRYSVLLEGLAAPDRSLRGSGR
jgi:glycosyltransferase involved in cell wall biosynthesis